MSRTFTNPLLADLILALLRISSFKPWECQMSNVKLCTPSEKNEANFTFGDNILTKELEKQLLYGYLRVGKM